MKKLLLLLASITLFSCTEPTTEDMAIAPINLGNVTFTYNNETTTYNGENDPNNPEKMVVFASLLQWYKPSVTGPQYFSLDSGNPKGAHFISIIIDSVNNQKSFAYAKNAVVKVQNTANQSGNPKNLQITITEETDTFISGTFYSNDINGTFTKIPKKTN
jgi:hypothetical protein